MKKIFAIVFFALCVGLTANAQTEFYKPFRVDLGIGYAIPTDYKAGITFGFEPKYAINDNIGVGLRWEGALLAADVDGASVQVNSTFLATGDYWFLPESSFRPFAGLGLGMTSLAGGKVSFSGQEVTGDSKSTFAGMIRAGFDVFHMRVAAEYMLTGKGAGDQSGNYIGISFNVFIGGGKR